MGEFGEQFRKAREQKKLSFDDVSKVIKISARMLKAIEEEHFEQLPGGVFNKGFVRTYAKHLGLNDDDAVDDYLKLIRQTQIEANELPQPEELGASRPKTANQPKVAPFTKRDSRTTVEVEELPDLQLPRIEHVQPGRKEFSHESGGIPWSMVALAAVIVSGATFLYLRHSRSNRMEPTMASAPAVNAAAVQPLQSPQAQPAALKTTSTAPTVPVAKSPGATREIHQTPLSPTPAAPTNSAADTGTSLSPSETSGTTPAAKSSGSLRLVIRATENSWVSVLADGQPVTQETLIAPAHTTIHADREIVARIGNAAGITFQWNGQEIAAQGLEGEAKTVVFDAQGMRVMSSSQPAAIP